MAGVLSGFIVPKLLSVQDYGQVQTVNLYMAYLTCIDLGFVSGLILKYSGASESTLPKSKFSLFFKLYGIWTALVCFCIFISSLFSNKEYKLILIFLSIECLFSSLNSFLGQLSYMVSAFKFSSAIGNASTVARVIILLLLLLLDYFGIVSQVTFAIYIFLYIPPILLLTVGYLIRFRKVVFCKSEKIKNILPDILDVFKVGLPFYLSGIIVNLITEVDRQFVQIYFDIESYAIYSFSYTMLRLVTMVTTSISTVLFPALKTKDFAVINNSYKKIVSVLSLIICFLSFSYYPFEVFVHLWLPKYVDTMPIFRVVMASYVFYSMVSIVNWNMFKLKYDNLIFFFISVVLLFLSVGFNYASYYVFGTMYSISFATLIVMLAWFIVTTIVLKRKETLQILKTIVFLMFFSIGFVLTDYLDLEWYFDLTLNLALFLFLLFLLQKDAAKEILRFVSIFFRSKAGNKNQ